MTALEHPPPRAWPRLAMAAGCAGALFVVPGVTTWLDAAYPLPGGIAGAAVYCASAMVAAALALVTTLAWGWPSWVAASRIRPDDSVAMRALRATVIAFALQPVVHALIILVRGRDLSPESYRLATLVAQFLLLMAAAAADRRVQDTTSWTQPRSIVMAVALLATSLLLISRIAWADLNPDGTELLTMGRSLSSFVVPRLPTGEVPGVNLGMLPIAYPIDFLLAVAGLTPAAARLPVLAYVLLTALGVTALVELKTARRLTTREFALLVAGALAVCLTISFNASYDPYSTDIASPASIDLLALVFLLATLAFFVAGEVRWCLAAVVLLALSRPSALLLCGMLTLALLVVQRDLRSRWLHTAVAATVTALVVSALYVVAIETLTGAQVSEGGGNLLLRIRFLRFDDWVRLGFLVVPAGIVPVLFMGRWRDSDVAARALTLVTLMYFGFFYVLAFISLHHFAPAMLLPLAVFWRQRLQHQESTTSSLQLATAAGCVVALAAALPQSMAPYRATRSVAHDIRFDVGEERGYALIRNTFDASRVLDSLFAPYWRVRDPAIERVGDPMSLAWYAALAAPSQEAARYVVQRETVPPPAGFTALGTARGFALFARDVATWERLRQSPPPPDRRSRLYDVPRTTLFQHFGRDAGVVQVDLRSVACGILPARGPCKPSGG